MIRFELSKEQIEAIVLPVGESHDAEALKRDKLKQLKETLAYMEQRLEKLEKVNIYFQYFFIYKGH